MTPQERARRALPCAFEDDDLPSSLIPMCSYYPHTSDEFPERCGQYVCPFRYRRRVEREIAEAEEEALLTGDIRVAAERARVLRLVRELEITPLNPDGETTFVNVQLLRAAIESGAGEQELAPETPPTGKK